MRVPTDNKPLPDVLLRAPLWMLAHDMDADDPALTAADPAHDIPVDGYEVDAAGSFDD